MAGEGRGRQGKRNTGGLRRGSRSGTWSPDPPQELRDMRWVYANPDREPQTPGQRMFLKLYREDIKAFIKVKKDAEEGWARIRAEVRVDEGSVEGVVDLGHERARALVEEVLARFERKRKGGSGGKAEVA